MRKRTTISYARLKVCKSIEDLKFQSTDTGSLRAQIAKVSIKIFDLTVHIKRYPDDVAAKQSLPRRLADRRKLLARLNQKSSEECDKAVSTIRVSFGARND